MSDILVGAASLGVATFLILLRVHVGLALGGAAVGGLLFLVGVKSTIAFLNGTPFEFAASWEFSAIPMFILMGNIAYHTGTTASLFKAARIWLCNLPGGLAVAANFACAGFAAASGSSLATSIAMGRLAIPEMRKFKYDLGLSTGVIAAAGTLGSLIPPSILLVLYGIFAEVSISELFLAGIIPGLLTAGIYAVMIITRCTLNPALAPRPDETYSTREKFAVLVDVWPLPVTILLVIGGIYTGFATPTEAGAVGVITTLVIAVIRRQLNVKTLKISLNESLRQTGGILFIALGAVLMTRLMAFSGLPLYLAETLQTLSDSPFVLILLTFLLYLVLGCFMDPIGIVLLTLPILLPMYRAMDINLIWFGIMVVKYVEIGLITPPLGLNVFAVKSLVPDVPIGVVFKGVGWFLLCEFLVVFILMAFPEIVLVFS